MDLERTPMTKRIPQSTLNLLNHSSWPQQLFRRLKANTKGSSFIARALRYVKHAVSSWTNMLSMKQWSYIMTYKNGARSISSHSETKRKESASLLSSKSTKSITAYYTGFDDILEARHVVEAEDEEPKNWSASSPFWISSSWVASHFLRGRSDFPCSVVSLDPSLALNLRFERNEWPEYDECDCDVLMNPVMSNLKKQLAE